MLRNDFAGMREGDLFHGRYRILRAVEDDRTSVTYEATDTITDTRQIIKLIRPDTIVGAGRRILFKGDAPAGETGDAAYLSNAGLDLATKSLFVIMEVEDDEDANAVTQIHDGALRSIPDISSLRRSPIPQRLAPPLAPRDMISRADPPLLRPLGVTPLPPLSMAEGPLPERDRVSGFATFGPLPPPTPPPMLDGHPSGRGSLPSLAAFGPLPRPTPPPEGISALAMPLPEPAQTSTAVADAPPQKRARMHAVQRWVVLVVAVVVAGSIAYFQLNRTEKEPTISEDVATTKAPPAWPTLSTDPATAAAATSTNAQPPETAPPKQEEIAPMTAPPNAQKSPTDHSARPTKKRRRETLY